MEGPFNPIASAKVVDEVPEPAVFWGDTGARQKEIEALA